MPDNPSHFRTTEVGTIPVQGGELKLVTVKSPSLACRADVSLYVPKQVESLDQVPVVILLHGVYCSHWAWALSGKAHINLQRLIDTGEIPPMILAMPSDGLWGDGSGYFEHSGKHFENWIVEDAPKVVSEVTGNSLEAPHFIAGLSMGGFGALRLGAGHPDRFQAFSGHSSITQLSEFSDFVEEPLGTYERENTDTCTVLETMLNNKLVLRPFRFDCGVDDPLIEGNRKLYQKLQENGIECSYEEYPGGHEWPYWEKHIEKSYRFFTNHL